MKGGRWPIAILLALAAALGGLMLFASQPPGAGPSTLAPSRDGWLAARRYLEAEGGEVTLLDRPFDALTARKAAVVVTTFPWRRLAAGDELEELHRYAAAGGTLVVGYSDRHQSLAEENLLAALATARRPVRRAPPLAPLAWRRHVEQRWQLEAVGGEAEPVVVRALDHLPSAPRTAEVLYRAPGGEAAIFSRPVGDGRVVLLPARALANGRLGEAGNADLLATLIAWLGADWTFDEYHHGLVAPGSAAERGRSAVAIDLFAAHLAVLYLAGLAAVVRRFGPPWREPPVVAGSAVSFLHGLGALHHRRGHHREAARRLLERIAELDPRLDAAPERAAEVNDGESLVALAGELADRRGGRPLRRNEG